MSAPHQPRLPPRRPDPPARDWPTWQLPDPPMSVFRRARSVAEVQLVIGVKLGEVRYWIAAAKLLGLEARHVSFLIELRDALERTDETIGTERTRDELLAARARPGDPPATLF